MKIDSGGKKVGLVLGGMMGVPIDVFLAQDRMWLPSAPGLLGFIGHIPGFTLFIPLFLYGLLAILSVIRIGNRSVYSAICIGSTILTILCAINSASYIYYLRNESWDMLAVEFWFWVSILPSIFLGNIYGREIRSWEDDVE